MGYGKQQIKDLEDTIENAECDLVLFATPIDLARIVSINKPSLRIRYEYKDHGDKRLEDLINQKLRRV
jgi:predicted GTPase